MLTRHHITHSESHAVGVDEIIAVPVSYPPLPISDTRIMEGNAPIVSIIFHKISRGVVPYLVANLP